MPDARVVLVPQRAHLEHLRLGGVIAQHARGPDPDDRYGTCTDDVARSIEVDLLHGAAFGWDAVGPTLDRALRYLDEAFVPGIARFRNQRTADGRWQDGGGSDDTQGRAIAALGQAMTLAGDPGHRSLAERLFRGGLPAARRLDALRPRSSVLLGCSAAIEGGAADLVEVEGRSLAGLVSALAPLRGRAWPWPDSVVTYEAALPARALIRAGRRRGDDAAIGVGTALLDWLLSAAEGRDGGLSFVGNHGWWPRDGVRARFDQQPIEASSTFLAAEAAYEATGGPRYRMAMDACHAWFLGANDLGVAVAIPGRGACRDGLTAAGVNQNQGAESTLAWLVVDARQVARGSGQAMMNAMTSR